MFRMKRFTRRVLCLLESSHHTLDNLLSEVEEPTQRYKLRLIRRRLVQIEAAVGDVNEKRGDR